MKEILINVKEPYYSLILKKEKNVEGRLNKGKFAEIKKGDFLILGKKKLKVLEKIIYKSFQEMIENEGVENVIPDKKTVNEAVEVYYSFYTQKDEKKFGVCAIKFEIV